MKTRSIGLTERRAVRHSLSSFRRANGPVFEFLSWVVPSWHTWVSTEHLICGENPILIALEACKKNIEGASCFVHCGSRTDPFWDYPMLFDKKAMKPLLEKLNLSQGIESVFDFCVRTISEQGNPDGILTCTGRLCILHMTKLDGGFIITLGMPDGSGYGKFNKQEKLQKSFESSFTGFTHKSERHGYIHVFAKEITICGGTPTWFSTSIEDSNDFTFMKSDHPDIKLLGGAGRRAKKSSVMRKQTLEDIFNSHPFTEKENTPCIE